MSGYKGKESIKIEDFIDGDIDEKIGGNESFDVMKSNYFCQFLKEML